MHTHSSKPRSSSRPVRSHHLNRHRLARRRVPSRWDTVHGLLVRGALTLVAMAVAIWQTAALSAAQRGFLLCWSAAVAAAGGQALKHIKSEHRSLPAK